MYLYFEVAGLEKDDIGATDYTIALSVSEEQGGGPVEIVADLFRELTGRSGEQGTVTTSWRRSGIAARTAESLRVVLPEPRSQDHQVTIRVTDHVTGESAEVTIELRISERPPSPEPAGS
ncbi:MAG: hypothetical protein R6W82_07800 [bacterium]